MNKYQLIKKIQEKNQKIPYNSLLSAILLYPIEVGRSLKNIDTILHSFEISSYSDPKELIFFIEEASRRLDCSQAALRESNRVNLLEEKYKKEEKSKEENDQLFFSIMESQGLMGSRNTSECVGCGIVVAANAQCRC